ncbi:MAG TPA: helix-turn-helix domain-containing protein [Burkholderiaceae bacterium]
MLRWSRRPKVAQALALRAQIVLLCAVGAANDEVARQLDVTPQTVGKWRRRFLRQRLDGLLDAPRSGAPRKISDDLVDRIVTMTLQDPPDGRLHWSSRTMARTCGVSQTAVVRIWRGAGLQPHVERYFRLSDQPPSRHEAGDLVGVFLDPPTQALALSAGPSRPDSALPAEAAETVFAALDAVAGERSDGQPPPPANGVQLLRFLHGVYSMAPSDDIVLLMNAPGLPNTPALRSWLVRQPRAQIHFAPNSESWVAQARHCLAPLVGNASGARPPGAGGVGSDATGSTVARGILPWVWIRPFREP